MLIATVLRISSPNYSENIYHDYQISFSAYTDWPGEFMIPLYQVLCTYQYIFHHCWQYAIYTSSNLHSNYVISTTSGADNCNNRSNYDTSNRFGTNTLWGSLFKKKTRATQNFNMAAIFQHGHHGILWNVIFCLKMALNGKKRLFWQ